MEYFLENDLINRKLVFVTNGLSPNAFNPLDFGAAINQGNTIKIRSFDGSNYPKLTFTPPAGTDLILTSIVNTSSNPLRPDIPEELNHFRVTGGTRFVYPKKQYADPYEAEIMVLEETTGNFTPSPQDPPNQSFPSDPPPTQPPIDTPQLYNLDLKTSITPQLPVWITERLRTLLQKGGWLMSNIYPYDGGYRLELQKQGSVSVLLLIGAAIAALALIFVTIREWRLVEVSKNETIQQRQTNASQAINDALSYCESAGLSQEECNDLLQKVEETYKGAAPPPSDDDDGLGNILKGSGLLLAGLAALALASKK